MGAMLQLIEMAGTLVQRKLDSSVYEWMRQISTIADNISGGTQAEVKYVNTAGSDVTGDGSFDNPFQSVQAAMTSITDATAAKPYAIRVEAGVYPANFTLKPFVHIIGAGSAAGATNASTLAGTTVINPNPAQVLDASWAGATAVFGAISKCSFSSACLANFATIGATGIARIFLDDVITKSAITLTGGSANSFAYIRDVYVDVTVQMTFTDMGRTLLNSTITSVGGGGITYNQAAAYQGTHELIGSYVNAAINVNWTSASIANPIIIRLDGTLMTNSFPVITGVGVQLTTLGSRTIAMSDAANRLSFGDNAAATLLGFIGATNVVRCTPTANRVLTIDGPISVQDTTIIIRNQSTAFNIDLTLVGGTIAPGSPTYVPPSSEVVITNDGFPGWLVRPIVQSGVVTLTSGVTLLIPADITANSRITATLKDINGGTLGPNITAKTADRVVGTRVGGGGFKLTSISAAGVTVATDNGIFDWSVNNSGG